MKKREFLKTGGIVAATLFVREGAGAVLNNAARRRKKALALNGSPHDNGNTAYALSVVGAELQLHDIDFEVIQVGKSDCCGCVACNSCHNDREKGCIHATDEERGWLLQMREAQAIILASPAIFGGMAGTLKAFLDRAFFSYSEHFRGKIGAAIVTARRSGASMTFESLNQYFTISQMPIASSTYWNNIRGLTVDDLKQDGEGIRTLQNLAKNIAGLINN